MNKALLKSNANRRQRSLVTFNMYSYFDIADRSVTYIFLFTKHIGGPVFSFGPVLYFKPCVSNITEVPKRPGTPPNSLGSGSLHLLLKTVVLMT